MKAEDLKINQLIEIEIENNDLSIERLPGRIEEVRAPYLVVSMPMKHGVMMPLRTGQDIVVVVSVRSGFFAARTKVLGRKRDPIPVLILEMPQEFKNIGQRRQYVRLEIALPVEFRLLGSNRELAVEQGTTSDISGGGVFMVSNVCLDPGQQVNMCLWLGKQDIIECRGVVVRSHQDADKRKTYCTGVKFLDISEKQRDKIFNFIFAKQREWIKKGLL